MKWAGVTIKTDGDLIDVVCAINRRGNREEADRFMEEYRKQTESADTNIGYLTGYMDRQTGREVRRLFGVKHPILDLDADPSPRECFDAGVQWMRERIG